MADKGGEKVTAPTAVTVDEALSKLSGASSDSNIPFSVELLKALAKGSQEAVQYAKQVNREYATTFQNSRMPLTMTCEAVVSNGVPGIGACVGRH